MVVAFVRLYPSLAPSASPTSRIYALLLPSANSDSWSEVSVRKSSLGGFGVYPQRAARGRGSSLDWSNLSDTPVALPYLGVETVVKDDHSRRALLSVLKGQFECVTVGELEARHGGGQAYTGDGLFVVPQRAPSQPRLLPDTRLLQVANSQSDQTSACYLLADDVRTALHLTGKRAHLFELLCAHASHEHADRHLATHVATLHRKEEGYVIVNAHPAFADPVSVTGMINEPASGETPGMKMTTGYARLLTNDDPLMRQLNLTQPADTVAAWREHILPPAGAAAGVGTLGLEDGEELWRCSERMVLYVTTRRAYATEHELTVDYGKSYQRDYASGSHRASCPRLYPLPPETFDAATTVTDWPNIPGWFNPRQQPKRRPAFATHADGTVRVLPDDPALVATRRAALGEARRSEADEAAGSRVRVSLAVGQAAEPLASSVPSPSRKTSASGGLVLPRSPRSPTTVVTMDLHDKAHVEDGAGLMPARITGAKRGRAPVSPKPLGGGASGLADQLSQFFPATRRRR